jgi:hypothetical protein
MPCFVADFCAHAVTDRFYSYNQMTKNCTQCHTLFTGLRACIRWATATPPGVPNLISLLTGLLQVQPETSEKCAQSSPGQEWAHHPYRLLQPIQQWQGERWQQLRKTKKTHQGTEAVRSCAPTCHATKLWSSFVRSQLNFDRTRHARTMATACIGETLHLFCGWRQGICLSRSVGP